MRFAKPGMSEGVLAAHFEYLCALGGAQRPAYVPVVGSGYDSMLFFLIIADKFARANSLTLHYTHNNQLIDEGELVLIDAGCEYKSVRLAFTIL